MATPSPLLDVLSRWNLWGSASLEPGLPRAVTSRIQPFVETPEVVALIGPRRAGKSTVLFQLMAARLAAGVDQRALLHVNLEEPALAPELDLPLLDRLYDLYYWHGKGEIDLLVRRGTAARALVQVVYEGMEQAEVAQRELEALQEGRTRFPKAEATVVVAEPGAEAEGAAAAETRVLPLWRLLLGER